MIQCTFNICSQKLLKFPEIQNRQTGKEDIGTIRATIKVTDNSKILPPRFEYKNDQKLILDHCLLGGLIAASAFQISQIILIISSFTVVSQDALLTNNASCYPPLQETRGQRSQLVCTCLNLIVAGMQT